MALPPAAPRTLSHTREVRYEGYRRDDGLWDIEAWLRDTKPHAFGVPGERDWAPNEPIHDMQIRLTVDDDFTVHAVAVAMNHIPHEDCPKAQPPMQKLVGCRLGRGWRRAVNEHLGGIAGCAHLRELLVNMATAAFQTMHSVATGPSDQPPLHLGQCVTWDFNAPLVERRYPMFFRWQPPARS